MKSESSGPRKGYRYCEECRGRFLSPNTSITAKCRHCNPAWRTPRKKKKPQKPIAEFKVRATKKCQAIQAAMVFLQVAKPRGVSIEAIKNKEACRVEIDRRFVSTARSRDMLMQMQQVEGMKVYDIVMGEQN